jgi:hypothetical protein
MNQEHTVLGYHCFEKETAVSEQVAEKNIRTMET